MGVNAFAVPVGIAELPCGEATSQLCPLFADVQVPPHPPAGSAGRQPVLRRELLLSSFCASQFWGLPSRETAALTFLNSVGLCCPVMIVPWFSSYKLKDLVPSRHERVRSHLSGKRLLMIYFPRRFFHFYVVACTSLFLVNFGLESQLEMTVFPNYFSGY